MQDGDVFQPNADFVDAAFRVYISSIQVKETVRPFKFSPEHAPTIHNYTQNQPEESRRTQNFIETDRRHALDAAIVPIMKSRKECTTKG